MCMVWKCRCYTNVVEIIAPNYAHCIKISQCLQTPNMCDMDTYILTHNKNNIIVQRCTCRQETTLVHVCFSCIATGCRHAAIWYQTIQNRQMITSPDHAINCGLFSDSSICTGHKRQVHHGDQLITSHTETTVQLKTIAGSGIWRLIPIRQRIAKRWSSKMSFCNNEK